MGLCCSGSMAGCVPVSRSSNLLRPSFIYQEVAQYGRALALDARGREFKSHLPDTVQYPPNSKRS